MTAPRTFSQRPYIGPPGSTELFLVRHGASADSVEGEAFELVEGQGDPPLSDVGRHQAELLALRLATEPFDGLYISTLQRTAQTAAPLVARSGMTPVVDADLREIFLGEWEGGLLRQKAHDRDPMLEQVWLEQRWDVIPGAESREVFGGRLRHAIERIAVAHPGGAWWSSATVPPSPKCWPRPAAPSPSRSCTPTTRPSRGCVVAPDRWIVRSYNDTAHLAG